jgi:hypothetical protein
MATKGRTNGTSFPKFLHAPVPKQRDWEEVTVRQNLVVNRPLWVSWLRSREMRDLTTHETGFLGRGENCVDS